MPVRMPKRQSLRPIHLSEVSSQHSLPSAGKDQVVVGWAAAHRRHGLPVSLGYPARIGEGRQVGEAQLAVLHVAQLGTAWQGPTW